MTMLKLMKVYVYVDSGWSLAMPTEGKRGDEIKLFLSPIFPLQREARYCFNWNKSFDIFLTLFYFFDWERSVSDRLKLSRARVILVHITACKQQENKFSRN